MRILCLGWMVLTFCLCPVVHADSVSLSSPSFFGLDQLWTFHLTLTADQWAAMEPESSDDFGRPPHESGPQKREYPWSQASFSGAGHSFTNVSLRFKGNSSFNMSRGSWKRPFKIDFNRGAPGRTLMGQQELLLNNNVNDATQFREALAYELFRRAGIPAPRTAFAQVYLSIPSQCTNQYLGLYTVVEAVEGQFLKRHFGSSQGLLLKPERVRGLEYFGPDWSAYQDRYVPKGDVKKVDCQRFMALNRLIAEGDDERFLRELPKMLDVPGFLKFVAINALLANYDSFLGMGHNYYLFQPSKTGPVRFIPWDLNEAFGGHPGAGHRNVQAEFSILKPQVGANRLLERVLGNPEWASLYRQNLEGLLKADFSPSTLKTLAQQVSQRIQESVFTESPRARVAFERSALLRNPTTMGEERKENRFPGDGSHPDRRSSVSFENPRRGFPGPRLDDSSFEAWLELRVRMVQAELSGHRTAPAPQMRGAPLRGPAGGSRGPSPRQPQGSRESGFRPIPPNAPDVDPPDLPPSNR